MMILVLFAGWLLTGPHQAYIFLIARFLGVGSVSCLPFLISLNKNTNYWTVWSLINVPSTGTQAATTFNAKKQWSMEEVSLIYSPRESWWFSDIVYTCFLPVFVCSLHGFAELNALDWFWWINAIDWLHYIRKRSFSNWIKGNRTPLVSLNHTFK